MTGTNIEQNPGSNNPPPSPPPPPPPTTWFSGFEAADVGHIQNRGWDRLEPDQIAPTIYKAFREAETKLGVPSDRLLRRPTEGNAEETAAFWQALGAPKDPKEYTFTGVDFGDPETTASFTEAARAAAASLYLPATQAAEFTRAMFKYMNDAGEKMQADTTAKLAEERRQLEVDWGKPDSATFKAHMGIADRTAAALGVPAEAFEKMKDGIGGAAVVKLFRQLGNLTGEAKYTTDPNNANELLTREQAIALRWEKTGIDEKGNAHPGKGDPTWLEKWRAKDGATMREWNAWLRIIAGE